MKVAVLGGGPAGLYFAISMKLRNSAHEVTVVERNRPDDTFGWGVVLSAETLDNLDAQRSGQRGLDQALLRLLGRHRGRLQGRAHGLDRPRLLRHRPQAAADAPAAARARTRHQARLRDRGPGPPPLYGNARPRRRRRRAELALARDLRRGVQARHRHAQMQVRLARHAPEIRRRLHLHLREDRARLGVGARLPVRQGHRDLHRRMQRGDLGEIRLRRDDAAGVDRDLRANLRKASRRPRADDQRQPHPRLGLDQFPARAVRTLVAREPRADGRRRGDARISRSARAPSWRWKARSRSPTMCIPSPTSRPPSRNTRTRGAPRC